MQTLFYRLAAVALGGLLLAGCDDPPQGQSGAGGTTANGAKTPIAKAAMWGTQAADRADGPLPDNATADNYYIIFDGSGSMNKRECTNGETKLDVAKEALAQWLRVVPASANVGLFAFDQKGASERIAMKTNGAAHGQALLELVRNINAGGNTPLGAAMGSALEALGAQAARAHGYGQYHIVVVTDGYASDTDLLRQVSRSIYDTPIIVHTIGFCIGERHVLNQPDLMIYVSANSPEQLAQGLENVLAESEDFVTTDFAR